MEWFEQARKAEQSGDWDTVIALVSAHAECYSADHYAHDNHLWHMHLLARADRLTELSELACNDVHARRRLNRSLRDRGMESALVERAQDGDRHALYCLVRRLCETSRTEQARHAVAKIDPENQYAQEIIAAAEASLMTIRGILDRQVLPEVMDNCRHLKGTKPLWRTSSAGLA